MIDFMLTAFNRNILLEYDLILGFICSLLADFSALSINGILEHNRQIKWTKIWTSSSKFKANHLSKCRSRHIHLMILSIFKAKVKIVDAL